MRALVLGATLGVALLVSPLWAQRGGGGGGHGAGFGGGGHAGGGGFAGRVGAPSGGHAVAGYRGWNGGGWNGRWNGRWGNNWGWRGNRYRFWGGYPYWGWGWGGWGWYPWWGWDDDSYDYDDSSYYPTSGVYAQSYPPYGYPPYGYQPQYLPPSGSAASYASQGEVQRIQQEVAQLREQQEARYKLQPSSTTLIYRDGHTENVTNYAIAGSTLWVFDQNHARKVPLSDLNLPATKHDNEEHGSEFVVPNTR